MLEEFPGVSVEPDCVGENPDVSNSVLRESFLERVSHLRATFPARAGHHLVATFTAYKSGRSHDIPVDSIDAIDEAGEPAMANIRHMNGKGEAAVVAVTAGAIVAAVIVWRKRDK